ncbi:MAG: hypothetical protein RLZZ126_1777 [Pseudomonadota bacterium]|jgi:aromatic ring-opening dioxygenase catalytic subunit (LigB family)
MTLPKLPTFFISHGGGPWPWMKTQTQGVYDQTEAFLKGLPASIGQPVKAVLMVSAHWEEPAFTLQSHPQPGMLYDYYGFPAHTYEIKYPAPGSVALAEQVHGLIAGAGLPAALDAQRGFDHGAFVPMAVMYPEAQMPMVQLSLKLGLDPAEHLALGRALAPLREQGVLILGSGFSFHNLRMYGPAAKAPSAQFDAWLQQTLVHGPVDQRSAALVAWERAPAARLSHPREEHLLPLMVAVGAAESEASTCVFFEESPLCTISSHRFG